MTPAVPLTAERKLPLAALVLEDDPLWASTLSVILSRVVDEVHHADNLKDGVRLWKEIEPAVIFVDVGLGSENGLDFVELVRSEDSRIPLLLVTGDNTQEVAVRAINLAVTRFVPKPATAEQLVDIVEDVLARHRRALDHRIQEQYFQALVELNADMILALSGDGEIRYATPSVHKQLGVAGALGYNVEQFVVSDDQTLWRLAWDEAIAHPGRVVDVTLRIVATDSRVRWLGLRLRNLLNSPDVSGMVVNARDVTEERDTQERLKAAEKRLQNELVTSEARYRALFDLLPVWVTVADDTGKIVDHNAAAREVLELGGDGDTNDSRCLIDMPLSPRIDPWGGSLSPEALPAVRALRTGQTILNEVIGFRDSRGRRRWLSVSAAPYELSHGGTGVVAVYPEVSEQIARQEEQWILLNRFNSTSTQLQLVNSWLPGDRAVQRSSGADSRAPGSASRRFHDSRIGTVRL
ncbi:MAG: PAS domain S-box protein [Alkalispirochaeta sp.]